LYSLAGSEKHFGNADLDDFCFSKYCIMHELVFSMISDTKLYRIRASFSLAISAKACHLGSSREQQATL
jgi:hypothetical protein